MMINNSYPNGDESQAQDPDPSDQDSQYAPILGYYEHMPPSNYGFSPSPDRCPQDGPDPLFSTQPETNKLLQHSEWEVNREDDEIPTSFTTPAKVESLDRRHPAGRTAYPPESSSFITARFVYVNQVIRIADRDRNVLWSRNRSARPMVKMDTST